MAFADLSFDFLLFFFAIFICFAFCNCTNRMKKNHFQMQFVWKWKILFNKNNHKNMMMFCINKRVFFLLFKWKRHFVTDFTLSFFVSLLHNDASHSDSKNLNANYAKWNSTTEKMKCSAAVLTFYFSFNLILRLLKS